MDTRPRPARRTEMDIGLLGLLVIAVLNVYKPAGLTPYGWRRERQA